MNNAKKYIFENNNVIYAFCSFDKEQIIFNGKNNICFLAPNAILGKSQLRFLGGGESYFYRKF